MTVRAAVEYDEMAKRWYAWRIGWFGRSALDMGGGDTPAKW